VIAFLRIWAVVGGLSLMTGEAYRSWGAGRPIPFWMDDMLAGGFLLFAAWALRRVTSGSLATMAAAWGFASGMLYVSFFDKLFDPARTDPGNFAIGVLTILVGIAFATALICLLLSIREAARHHAR
jgi:hypothetical protein